VPSATSSPRKRLGSPSGRLPKTDPALRHWLGVFHQFHTEDDTYITHALRLLPVGLGLDKGGRGSPAGTEPGAVGRCVYEVALHRDARGERWVLILWEVDVPGIQFCDCEDREEAMALFAEPSRTAGRWHGVRVQRAKRPW
jgi:hypothetical protein